MSLLSSNNYLSQTQFVSLVRKLKLFYKNNGKNEHKIKLFSFLNYFTNIKKGFIWIQPTVLYFQQAEKRKKWLRPFVFNHTVDICTKVKPII